MAASIHMAVSSPNCAMMEVYNGNKQDGPFGNVLLKEPLDMGPGYARVPERPGLGVDFDERRSPASRWQGEHDDTTSRASRGRFNRRALLGSATAAGAAALSGVMRTVTPPSANVRSGSMPRVR